MLEGPRIKFILIFASLTGLLILLHRTLHLPFNAEYILKFLYALLFIAFISMGLTYGGRLKQQLRHAVIWAGIFSALIVGYSFRQELAHIKNRVIAQVLPGRGISTAPRSMSFQAAADNHFYIQAHLHETPVLFLADTGASHIVLNRRDARRIGIDPDSLPFDRFYQTANGRVRGSSIRLRNFRVGDLILYDVDASINEAPMRHSLLGMTFFRRLESYRVADDVLTIRWRDG